jgi:hypothetical protein
MPNIPTFTDRVVQYPRRGTITKVGGGALSSGDTVTLSPEPGTITEVGTPVNASNLNAIGTAIKRLQGTIALGGLIG